MHAFRYEAVDAHGKLKRGLVDAETARQVRDQLRAEGLFPTAIDAEGADPATTHRRERRRCERLRLPAAQVALSTRQLATLVRSGMPLDQALSAVAEQADDARAAKLFARGAHAGRLGRAAGGRAFALAANVLRSLSRPRRGRGGNRQPARCPHAARRLSRSAAGAEAAVHAGARLPRARDDHRVRGDRRPAGLRRAADRRRSTSRAGRRCRGSRRR